MSHYSFVLTCLFISLFCYFTVSFSILFFLFYFCLFLFLHSLLFFFFSFFIFFSLTFHTSNFFFHFFSPCWGKMFFFNPQRGGSSHNSSFSILFMITKNFLKPSSKPSTYYFFFSVIARTRGKKITFRTTPEILLFSTFCFRERESNGTILLKERKWSVW